jgi:hypothetical protein
MSHIVLMVARIYLSLGVLLAGLILYPSWKPRGRRSLLVGLALFVFPWTWASSAGIPESYLERAGIRSWTGRGTFAQSAGGTVEYAAVPVNGTTVALSLVIAASAFFIIRWGLRSMLVAIASGFQAAHPKCPSVKCRYILIDDASPGVCPECGVRYTIDILHVVALPQPDHEAGMKHALP